jgi:pimeloyl-ACP methyl ester carboxylesterase
LHGDASLRSENPMTTRPGLRRRTLGALALAVAAGTAATAAVRHRFADDLAAARARVAQGSRLVDTRAGPIEVGIGDGTRPLLMVHGTGGGFDQGLQFAERLSAKGWRVIAPSRFGYLRTPFAADASSEAQADAFAHLLDALRIERLPVLGGSAGALSALQFALRHPQRCSALVPIVPATFVPGRPATPVPAPWAERVIASLLGSDFVFWSGLTLAPEVATKALLATDAEVVAEASAEEQARVRRILWSILPVSARAAGLVNDARLASRPAPMPLERITAPTLAVSVRDDRFGTFAAAHHIAVTVPGARLLAFDRGGHIWAGHDAELFDAVDAFLRSKEVQ